jgi:protein-tyrosine phosphatase
MRPRFIDCHSHVVPSGDDGVGSIDEGIALCREAARHGTSVLYATPHVWPHLVLTESREAAVREAFAAMRKHAGLDLRLGWELTPTSALLDEDPHRYVLDGTDCVLMEVPFVGAADLLLALGDFTATAGLQPVIAHPERTEAVLDRPSLADEFATRGWLLQVNATSLLGRHGEEAADLGWDLLDREVATIVASDGHRPTRPPHLDEAYELAARRLGEERALSLFDGSALAARPSRPASRAASTKASLAMPTIEEARALPGPPSAFKQ